MLSRPRRQRAAFLALACLCGVAAATESEVDDSVVAAHDDFLSWLESKGFPEHNLTLAMFESPEVPGTYYRGAWPRRRAGGGPSLAKVAPPLTGPPSRAKQG